MSPSGYAALVPPNPHPSPSPRTGGFPAFAPKPKENQPIPSHPNPTSRRTGDTPIAALIHTLRHFDTQKELIKKTPPTSKTLTQTNNMLARRNPPSLFTAMVSRQRKPCDCLSSNPWL
jgi:hypothetical protein